MNQRRHVTLVAAAATLLATAPLSTVFQAWTWSVDVLLAVAAICGAALGTRALRTPLWAQSLAMLGALVVMSTWLFGAGALLGTIPTATTLRHFGDLLTGAGRDISDFGVPVPDRDGLLFLTTVSVGLVAILVDLVTVGLRRPALAGFPMLAMYWIPVLVHPDSVSLIPFVVGAAGFLWLLVTDNVDRVRRFGRRFTGEGRDVDIWEPSPLAAAGRRLATVGVVLAVLLPLAVPGMTNGLLGRFGTNGGGAGIGPGIGGSGAQVNLFSALSGQLNQTKQQDMVRLTTNDPAPYYMRFGVADRVTDQGFSARPPADGVEATGPLPDPAINANGVSQHKYTASVQILNLNMSLLPIYTQPTKIQKLGGSWFYDRGSGLLYSSRETSSGRQYNFEFLHTEFTATALRTAKPLSSTDEIQRLDTQVPGVTFVDNLVASLTKDKQTVYDKVRALYDYFSADNHFTYALTTKSSTSGSDIVDFLTNKQGYCEQYASALAWLVRAAGIPARVAFGFTRGGNRDRDTYTLTNYNLHAWTEVYFAGFGWVPFDATPVANIAGAVSPAWAPDVNHKDNTGGTGTSGAANPNSASAQTDQGKNPNDAEGQSSLGAGTRRTKRPTWPYWAFGSAALVLLLLAAPSLRRSALRRRRRPKAAHARADGPPMDIAAAGVPGQMRVVEVAFDAETARGDAHAAWDELIDTLVDYRIPLDEAETPRVTAERVATMLRLSPEAAEGVRRLGSAEERARYAKVPLPAGGLAAALRTVRMAIAGRAPRWTRIRAVLLPPSVLHRWSESLVAGANATATAVGRRRDAAVRSLQPRRLLLIGRTGRGAGRA
jgi:transglutaminase-like putative cysteine protease